MFEKWKEKYPEDVLLRTKIQSIFAGGSELIFVREPDAEKAEDHNKLFRACCGESAVVVNLKTMMDELIELIVANSDTDEFYDKYQKCRVLVVDGFQLCFGKTATQQELYQLFRYRADNNLATVVMASFIPKKDGCLLSDRLFGLFEVIGD